MTSGGTLITAVAEARGDAGRDGLLTLVQIDPVRGLGSNGRYDPLVERPLESEVRAMARIVLYDGFENEPDGSPFTPKGTLYGAPETSSTTGHTWDFFDDDPLATYTYSDGCLRIKSQAARTGTTVAAGYNLLSNGSVLDGAGGPVRGLEVRFTLGELVPPRHEGEQPQFNVSFMVQLLAATPADASSRGDLDYVAILGAAQTGVTPYLYAEVGRDGMTTYLDPVAPFTPGPDVWMTAKILPSGRYSFECGGVTLLSGQGPIPAGEPGLWVQTARKSFDGPGGFTFLGKAEVLIDEVVLYIDMKGELDKVRRTFA